MPFWKRTPKPSETALLLSAVTHLTAQVISQAESQRKMSEKLLAAVEEKDNQIRMVLESKFQPYVTVLPERKDKPQEQEDPQYLSDVIEMSEQSAEAEVIKATTAYNNAETELAKQLAWTPEELEEGFQDLAKEHAEAHREVQA